MTSDACIESVLGNRPGSMWFTLARQLPKRLWSYDELQRPGGSPGHPLSALSIPECVGGGANGGGRLPGMSGLRMGLENP